VIPTPDHASDFAPLTPPQTAARGADSFRLKILSGSGGEIPFTPVTSLVKAVIRSASSDPAQPVVSVQREGDRVTSIRIQCTCGQLIELACDYGA
jgi:hypothetical protein